MKLLPELQHVKKHEQSDELTNCKEFNSWYLKQDKC